MNLYTKALRQTLQQKFTMNPHGDHHSYYSFVCSPQLRPVRNRIEKWLDEFPELTSNKNFIRPFISPKSHKQAISELVMGVALKRIGFNVEHNKLFEGLTPDWYAYGKPDIPNLVVEVTTINPPPSRQAVANKIDVLLNSIRRLQMGVMLQITLTDPNAEQSFRSSQLKEVVKSIEMWLRTKPAVAAKHQIAGFQFEIQEWKAGTLLMTTKGPIRSFTIDPTVLVERIKEKVNRYKSTILSNGLAFWVAIQADNRVGLSLDNLGEILSGRRAALSKAESKLPVDRIRLILSPNNKGLFENTPLLSGVIWIENDFQLNYWNLIPYYNPFAEHKLPDKALPEIRFLPTRTLRLR